MVRKGKQIAVFAVKMTKMLICLHFGSCLFTFCMIFGYKQHLYIIKKLFVVKKSTQTAAFAIKVSKKSFVYILAAVCLHLGICLFIHITFVNDLECYLDV